MPDLSSNSRKILLDLARQALQSYLDAGNAPDFHTDNPELLIKRGCFVTLHLQKKLRGCVGTFEAEHCLYENVIRMSLASAFRDTRFPPLTKGELNDLQIQISVLCPLTEMQSLSELEIGRHGVLVRLGARSGTYLPEVAVEQKWRPEEFVVLCAREKAGLAPEECSRAQVFLYEVEKFES